MERRGDDKNKNGGGVKKNASACDVEALQKCLEEHKGDYFKCQAQIEAFKSSCALKKPTSYSLSPRPRPTTNFNSSVVTEL